MLASVQLKVFFIYLFFLQLSLRKKASQLIFPKCQTSPLKLLPGCTAEMGTGKDSDVSETDSRWGSPSDFMTLGHLTTQNHLHLTVSFVAGSSPVIVHRPNLSPHNARILEERDVRSKRGKIVWLQTLRIRKQAHTHTKAFFFRPLSSKKDKSQEFLSVWNKKISWIVSMNVLISPKWVGT